MPGRAVAAVPAILRAFPRTARAHGSRGHPPRRPPRDHLEGIPLDLAARLLPRRTRFSLGLGPHIHLHARAQRTRTDDSQGDRRPAGSAGEGTMSASKRWPRSSRACARRSRGCAGSPLAPTGPTTRITRAMTRLPRLPRRPPSAAALRAAGRHAGLGPRRQHGSLQSASRPRRLLASWRSTSIRRAVERGYLAIRADGRTDITAASCRPHRSEPWAGLGERRATRPPRAHRDGRHPRPRPRPPPRDRPQRAAADGRCALRASIAARRRRMGAQGGRHGAAASGLARGHLRPSTLPPASRPPSRRISRS